jgi:hypothetical protein
LKPPPALVPARGAIKGLLRAVVVALQQQRGRIWFWEI